MVNNLGVVCETNSSYDVRGARRISCSLRKLYQSTLLLLHDLRGKRNHILYMPEIHIPIQLSRASYNLNLHRNEQKWGLGSVKVSLGENTKTHLTDWIGGGDAVGWGKVNDWELGWFRHSLVSLSLIPTSKWWLLQTEFGGVWKKNWQLLTSQLLISQLLTLIFN